MNPSVMQYRLAVDTGGTFTDLVVLDEAINTLRLLKVPSTPDDPSRALAEGLERLAREGADVGAIAFFVHGTTVGTNALLQGRGAKVGVLTTKGFRGIYCMDQVPPEGPEVFDPFSAKPDALLTPPRFVGDVEERVDFEGNVLQPLSAESARSAFAALRAKGADAFAVCFLFSFLNPIHERQVGELIRELADGCFVSLSSEIVPRIREYPRISTTVANAYIGPLVSSYLERLEERLHPTSVGAQRAFVTTCTGGMTTFHRSSRQPINTVLSGPAGGVVAAREISRAAGFDRVIGLDMGGTSCDLSLINERGAVERTETRIGRVDLAIPALDITTIGAGGGTMAFVDRLGDFRVGPESAGAVPGPVCYGQSGTQPAVTDANLVLGFLNPDYFLSGEKRLDVEGARSAIAGKIAAPLGLDVLDAAHGIIRVVNENMEQAIKAISTERGIDLRDYVLFAFGGAGPVHAGKLAEDLSITKVLVPPAPGLTSSIGLLMSDVRHDYVLSRLKSLDDVGVDEMNEIFGELRGRASAEFASEGLGDETLEYVDYLDVRYAGQGYEITVEAPALPIAEGDRVAIRAAFEAYHEQLFGHRAPTQPVEIVSYRLKAWAKVPKYVPSRIERIRREGPLSPYATRPVYFGRGVGSVDVPIYRRETLAVGDQLMGPAIVEQVDSTVVVYPGQKANVDEFANLLISPA